METGDNVVIGGFIVQGSGPKRVIIRALGPELTEHGVADALHNPDLGVTQRHGSVNRL